jgi:hypothetical protein
MALKKKVKKQAKRQVKKKLLKKKVVKKKVVKKKPALKKSAAKNKTTAAAAKKAKEGLIGIVTHYFPHVNAAVVKLKAPLSVGEKVRIKGHTTDFLQVISSMQIDRVPIKSAKKGAEVGLLVDTRVRQHDVVCKA